MSSTLTPANIYAGLDIPEHVRQFAHNPGTRVRFGPGVLTHLGEEAAPLGRRAMIVTDHGLRQTGYVERAQASLTGAGVDVVVFDEVHENPTTADVRRVVRFAESHSIDLLIGLGGGSSMDAAKGCNFILTNGGEMKDYWGKEKASKPMLPLIAIPTTAGTGSECQSFALIADEHTHAKMACGDKKAAARVALLDPELTLTQPKLVTAVTAIDAVSHALESYVSLAATDISRSYARAAFHLMRDALPRITSDPRDLLGRARMQLGAAMAGTSIENSMLGAAHSMANPLTAHFGIIHGQAVGACLPTVVRRNATQEATRARYAELHEVPLDQWVSQQLEAFGLTPALASLGVPKESLPTLAEEAAQQWTAQFNPVPLETKDFLELYQECF